MKGACVTPGYQKHTYIILVGNVKYGVYRSDLAHVRQASKLIFEVARMIYG
jgi:hypothetical protein